MKSIVELCARYGFSLHRAKNHLVFLHPLGARLVTSKTASDSRALRNIERDIKKILKGAK